MVKETQRQVKQYVELLRQIDQTLEPAGDKWATRKRMFGELERDLLADEDSKRRQMGRVIAVLLSLIFLFVIGGIYGFYTCIPRTAIIEVPFDSAFRMKAVLDSQGIHAIFPNGGGFGVIRFHVENGMDVWIKERLILSIAREDEYFCSITYTPYFKSWKWEKRIGDASGIGLQ